MCIYSGYIYIYIYAYMYILHTHMYICWTYYVYTGIHHVVCTEHVLKLCDAPYTHTHTLLIRCQIVWSLNGQSTGWGPQWSSSIDRLSNNCSSELHIACCNVQHNTYDQNNVQQWGFSWHPSYNRVESQNHLCTCLPLCIPVYSYGLICTANICTHRQYIYIYVF